MFVVRNLRRITSIYLAASFLFTGPGVASEDAEGFSVNRFSRNQVVAFWHRYYQASEGYENRWAGQVDFANCTLSEPPAEFTKDIQRRVNYYRAMAGLPANASFENTEVFSEEGDAYIPSSGTTKAQAARAAALALASQGFDVKNPSAFILTHELDDTFGCFNAAAWNGARNSNLAALLWGPGAIDGYMEEFGTVADPLSNKFVGHRRWILFSAVAKMASGDVPPRFEGVNLVRAAVNALYVVGDFQERQLQFVAWPNDGYVPAPIVPKLWSLSYPGADFSEATVSIKGPNGQPIAAEVVSRSLGIPRADQPPLPIPAAVQGAERLQVAKKSTQRISFAIPEKKSNGILEPVLPPALHPQVKAAGSNGPGVGNYADSTIVWQPANLPENFENDSEYEVTVSNIKEAPQSSFTYKVAIIDPNVLRPFELTGTDQPPVEGANYYFGGAGSVDDYEFEISQRSAYDKTENAEGELNIVDQSIDGVDLVGSYAYAGTGSNSNFSIGKNSFRLAFKDSVANPPEHGFEIAENFSTQAGAKLSFQYRRGFMSTTTHMDVEFSTDGGVSWQASGTRISGSGGPTDAGFSSASVDLINSSSLRIRFRQRYVPDGANGFFTTSQGAHFPIGIFLDDISFSNVEVATAPILVGLSGTSKQVKFTPEALGEDLRANEVYSIRVRPKIAGFSFAWSPVKQVTVQPSSALVDYARWAEFSYPTAGDFHDDFDGDGLVDGHEYALGTSPIDGTDGLSSLGLAQEGDQLCLTAPGSGMQSGVSYQAEWTTDLENWTSSGVIIQDIGGQIKALAPAGGFGNVHIRWVISPK